MRYVKYILAWKHCTIIWIKKKDIGLLEKIGRAPGLSNYIFTHLK